MVYSGMVVVITKGAVSWGGRVTEPFDDRAWWIDVNLLGSHVLELYRVEEIASTLTVSGSNEDSISDLCKSCIGYGLTQALAGMTQCGECKGSGRPDSAPLKCGVAPEDYFDW
jgi:hypothetical protein